MLNRHACVRGFSVIAVVGALIIISLLMIAALQVVRDHRARSALSADHALALREADAALDAAECRLALATGTPGGTHCTAATDPVLDPKLNPVTLAGFTRGTCGNDGLCWPQGQTIKNLAGLLDRTSSAKELPGITAMGLRKPGRHARYVIEPIPDEQPGQWIHAGAAPPSHLFRITAAGFGVAGAGEEPAVNVMLQVVYRPSVAQP